MSSFPSLRVKSASNSGAEVEVVLTEGLQEEDYSGACAGMNSTLL